ncbi:hypothetical protein B5X24_HaOG212181 [Helicoverpa armigera]|nr:hypothetical protein B5X24_HaOG212181 [Helicoverpa armigera]
MKIEFILIIAISSAFTAPTADSVEVQEVTSQHSERIDDRDDVRSSHDEEGFVPGAVSTTDLNHIIEKTEDVLDMVAKRFTSTDAGPVGPATTSLASSIYRTSTDVGLPISLSQEHATSQEDPLSNGFVNLDSLPKQVHSIKKRGTVWLDTAHAVTHYKVSQDYPKLHEGNHHVISKDYPEPNLVRVTLCDTS